jgi:hypothetical protein
LTLLTGVVAGGVGFFNFVQQAASDTNDLVLRAAGQGADVSTTTSMGLTAMAPLVFVVGTPLGWLSAYLTITGLIRSIATVTREPLGDPILALLLLWKQRTATTRVRARTDAAREAAEGPEVRDRLTSGERFGLAAHVVVVASRPKLDWTPGTILDCGDRFYTVGEAEARTLPQGLRTLYPLTETPDAGVFRRLVRYDLPVREPERPQG